MSVVELPRNADGGRWQPMQILMMAIFLVLAACTGGGADDSSASGPIGAGMESANDVLTPGNNPDKRDSD